MQKDVLNNKDFTLERAQLIKCLLDLRSAELEMVVPFMNGDFTQWDLYLALSSEYAVRLTDGFISMLESRNLVCAAQLLRAQVGTCLRTFALFAAKDQDAFLERAFNDGRIDRMRDYTGKKMTDARLQELLEPFDSQIKNVYAETSGWVHFSTSILPSMATSAGDWMVDFNFGADPNEKNNKPLLECAGAFCHYVDLHLQMLSKVVVSDGWYADRLEIHQHDSGSECTGSLEEELK